MHFLSLHLPGIFFFLYFAYNCLTSLLLIFEQKHKLMDFLEVCSASTSSGDTAWTCHMLMRWRGQKITFSTLLAHFWSEQSPVLSYLTLQWHCSPSQALIMLSIGHLPPLPTSGHLLLLKDTTSFPPHVPGYIHIKWLSKSFLKISESLVLKQLTFVSVSQCVLCTLPSICKVWDGVWKMALEPYILIHYKSIPTQVGEQGNKTSN